MAQVSFHAGQVLRALAKSTNVVLVGPPATGKSQIMAEVKAAFGGSEPPAYNNSGPAPFPRSGNHRVEAWMPSPSKTDRKVFHITFHQATKHRQFVSGISPKLSENSAGFEVTEGLLLDANNHASKDNSTALMCIDEINRGPAVAIFGDTLTAIEADKRLDENNKVVATSAPFHAHVKGGDFRAHYLSPHLYILAAMNEADISVEPLDVAFLRRFLQYRLSPEPNVAAQALGVDLEAVPPDTPSAAKDVYQALFAAWKGVNDRISLGRSPAFQIGHGVLMGSPPPNAVADALQYSAERWARIEAHVDEVFFGNDQARGVVYNAREGGVFALMEQYFGDQAITVLRKGDASDIYKLLIQVAKQNS